jgi:hypothetical protein
MGNGVVSGRPVLTYVLRSLQAWNKQDYCWNPYGLTAESIKSAKGGLSAITAAPAVNTRSSGRVHKEITHAPAGRTKGPMCCQVETCQVNLESSKEYHIRYRIVSPPPLSDMWAATYGLAENPV